MLEPPPDAAEVCEAWTARGSKKWEQRVPSSVKDDDRLLSCPMNTLPRNGVGGIDIRELGRKGDIEGRGLGLRVERERERDRDSDQG